MEFFNNKKFRSAVILVTGVVLKNRRSIEQTTIHSSLDGTLIEKGCMGASFDLRDDLMQGQVQVSKGLKQGLFNAGFFVAELSAEIA